MRPVVITPQYWVARGTPTRVSDSSFTITNSVENQVAFAIGKPIRYRGAGGTWRYGIVTNYAAGTVTLAGAPMTVADDDEVSSGSTNNVVQWDFNVPGTFATAAETDLLRDVAKTAAKWGLSAAYIVRVSAYVVTTDSGANKDRVNATVGGNAVLTDNANAGLNLAASTTWYNSVATCSTANYVLAQDSVIELSTDANGSNGDASDLVVSLTIVIE